MGSMILESIESEGQIYLSKKSLCIFLEQELANHKVIEAESETVLYINGLIKRLIGGEYTPHKSTFEEILSELFGLKKED
jgi:hypothetical protein